MYIIHIIYYISIYYVIYIIDQSIYNIYYIFIVSPHPTPTPTHPHTQKSHLEQSDIVLLAGGDIKTGWQALEETYLGVPPSAAFPAVAARNRG